MLGRNVAGAFFEIIKCEKHCVQCAENVIVSLSICICENCNLLKMTLIHADIYFEFYTLFHY